MNARRPTPKVILRRRRNWMAKRKAHGLERPRPLGMIEVNTMSISTGLEHAKQILRNAAAAVLVVDGVKYSVDYITGCEGDDFDAAKVLGKEWDVHHDQSHEDKDGSFQAIRKTRGRLDDTRMVKGSNELPGILPARWVSVALVVVDPGTVHRWLFKGAAGHAPPKRAWIRWPQFMAAMRRIGADVTGADFNKLLAAIASAFARRVGGRGLLSIATRWRIPVSPVIAVDVDGDHLAVARVLWPHPKEKS